MGKRSRLRKQLRTEEEQQAAQEAVGAAGPAGEIDRRKVALIMALLSVAVVLIFAQVRRHQFVDYDDPIYVTSNEHVQAGLTAGGLRWAFTSLDFNWHPVTWISHMLDVELFGLAPGRHLLMNAAYHLVNTLLLFALLLSMTRLLWRSAAVAALFAVHPLHVESVAWISERKDVLAALFFLVTIAFYVRFVRTRSLVAYALMFVALALGLASKGMLVTMPFVLLLLDYWPLGRFRKASWSELRTPVLEKLPLFLLILPGVWITLKAQQAVEAVIGLEKIPTLARIANALLAYVSYIGKTLWPADLAIPYPYRVVISPTATVAATILILAITGAVVWARERYPYLFAGWFWFVGMLVPVIGLVQIGHQAMADRYTYLPHIGFFLAVVWLVAEWASSNRVLKKVVAGGSVLALVALMFAARAQASYWRDSVTLFGHAVEATPRNHIAHLNLGSAFLQQNQYAEAEAQFRASLAVFDRNAPAHAGLGSLLSKSGRFAEAERELRLALALDPENTEVLRELGRVLVSSGKAGEAVQVLEKAQQLDDNPQGRAELALARGQIPEAIQQYEEGVQREPESASLRNDLAAALARQGRDQDAVVQYQHALRIDPHHYDARMNFGALLSRQERDAEAIEQFQAAALERPSLPEPRIYSALVLAKLGRFAEAAREIELAIQINPEASNTFLTNAIRIPYKPTNIHEYLGYLQSQASASPGGQ